RHGKYAKLRWRHAHRACAAQQVFQANADAAQPGRGDAVKRAYTRDLDHDAQLQVILQVFAHPGQRMPNLDARLAQLRRLADAGQLQQLRRVDRPGAQRDFAPGTHFAAIAQPHPDATRPVEQQALDVRTRGHAQVGPLAHRAQEGARSVPAPARLLVDFEVADAEVIAPVEVLHTRDAGFGCRLREGLQDVPTQPLRFDAPFAACAMHVVGAAVVVLASLEI